MENDNANGKEHGERVVNSATLHVAGTGLGADLIECPLCIGRGHLKRSEVLERLGMKDLCPCCTT